MVFFIGMIVVLDFGSALSKALIVEGDNYRFFRFSLSYSPQDFSQKSLLESLKRIENLSGSVLFSGDGKLTAKVYVTTGLPMVLGGEGASTEIISESKIIVDADYNLLSLGFRFVHYKDKVAVVRPSFEEILKWLPFKLSLSEIDNYWSNKEIYSNALPIFPRDLYLEQATAREVIIQFRRSQGINFSDSEIVLSGRIFSLCPYPSQSLLIFLDSFAPSSKTDVYLDKTGLALCLGLLKLYESEAYNHLPDSLLPEFLGTVLPFDTPIHLEIDLGLSQIQTVDVPENGLFLFPLESGETARLKVVAMGKKESYFDVSGGSLGFVVDCRSYETSSGTGSVRTLSLPANSAKRMELLKSWERSLSVPVKI